jgi:hypothetical protein
MKNNYNIIPVVENSNGKVATTKQTRHIPKMKNTSFNGQLN